MRDVGASGEYSFQVNPSSLHVDPHIEQSRYSVQFLLPGASLFFKHLSNSRNFIMCVQYIEWNRLFQVHIFVNILSFDTWQVIFQNGKERETVQWHFNGNFTLPKNNQLDIFPYSIFYCYWPHKDWRLLSKFPNRFRNSIGIDRLSFDWNVST